MPNVDPLIVYYHSVAPAPFKSWSLRFLTMELARFEAQLDYIQERSWKTIFLDEWWSVRSGKRRMEGDEICLTFDDGLLDNWVYAFPVVKRKGMKFTVFVCPELIEASDKVRPTLEDVWNGKCELKDLQGLGQLSWGELKAMQASGHVDIQSHTMSHAKYIISDRLRGFYYGGFEGYYPTMNTYDMEQKPFYANHPGFQARIPLGSPLFEETSSVIAHRVWIDEEFTDRIQALSKYLDLEVERDREHFGTEAGRLYQKAIKGGSLIFARESFQDHVQRLEYELIDSKRIIESRLDKPVDFLCWPHGDNSQAVHAVAKEVGYVATTVGKVHADKDRMDRIPRIGTDWPMDDRRMRMKMHYKMASHLGKEPYRSIARLNELKNDFLNKH